MTPKQILQNAESVLVIDWPSKEVPEVLVRAGLRVFGRGGPGPEDFSVYESNGGAVAARRIGRPPERADLIYAFRPLRELPEIIALAKSLSARAVWTQSGLTAAGEKDARGCWVADVEREAARKQVESAGLHYISEPYIGKVAGEMQESPGGA